MGLNNLGSVQALLAQNIRGGLSGLGDRPLDEAQFGLNKAQIEHTMGRQQAQDLRQSEMDKLQRPGFEVQSQVAQGQLDAANAPVRITDFATDMNTLEHMMYTPQDNWEGAGKPQDIKDPLITRLAGMYGATWDTNPQSPTRGQMLKSDGTPITKLMLNRDTTPLKAFMTANTGLDHETRKNEEQLLRGYQNGKLTKDEYDNKMAQINKFKSSLPAQMKYAQGKIDFLSKFTNQGNPLFKGEMSDGLKRWQGKYDKLEATLAQKQEKEIEHKRKKEIEKLKKEPEYGDKVEYQVGEKKMTEVYRGGGKWVKTEGPMWQDSESGENKVPDKIKQAQDLFKNLTKEVSESAGAILARAMAGDMLTPADMKTIKNEKVDERKQGLLDSVIGILEEYYGVEKKPEPFGLRKDGTPKGDGWLGVLPRTDKKGMVSTEISIGVEFDGKETLIPTLVPTLTKKEIDYLLAGGEVTDAIMDKAVAHAKERMSKGLSPFKEKQAPSPITHDYIPGQGLVPRSE